MMESKEQLTSQKLESIRELLNKYRALRSELTSTQGEVKNESDTRGSNSFVRRKTKAGMPSMLDPDYKQGGFIQVLMLSFFTLFFEGLFLLLSYFIFS